ncbi:hypothetical protein Tco_0525425 [Tanacetum coccineum]
MKVVQEEEIAIDVIPLATKPPRIIDWKIVTEGKKSFYLIIRASGQSKRYLTFGYMLKDFDKEDLETMWKLMKNKNGSTRPEGGFERVLWGYLNTMFEPHVEDEVWKLQQQYMVGRKDTIPTITDMLDKKLQVDHFNEMAYQLLKLIKKQQKNK